ncbi:MAG: hypothetical protein E4G91_00855 [Candidatus Zixiibacteriota bacterium]|nr:MAG: hypothetical protein E4G91_00855 [candidate division Zixibacteria bacterium]
MSKLILMCSCVAILGLFVTAGSVQAKVFQFKTTNEYAVEKYFELTVSNTSGMIEVSYVAGDKVVVETIKEIDASSRKEAERLEERLEVAIRASKKSIDIDTNYPHGRSSAGFLEELFRWRDDLKASVKYVIEVPTSVNLEISSTSGDVRLLGLTGWGTISGTSGDIKVVGFTGDLKIRTTSGDISFKDVKGNIDANSTSSDILFDNVTGDVVVQSTSGDTEAHWLIGGLRITKTSGDVRLDAISGDIDIKTTSGNIEIGQKEGSVFVSTSSGDVRVRSEMTNGKRFEVETISGDITMAVPSEMKGRVRLETISGSIDTDLSVEVRSFNKHRLEGRVGGDGPEVILSTTSGDINLDGF